MMCWFLPAFCAENGTTSTKIIEAFGLAVRVAKEWRRAGHARRIELFWWAASKHFSPIPMANGMVALL